MRQECWQLAHASLKGRGHEKENIPCQDSHYVAMFNNEWGIAVVADGAGSRKNSHVGSSFVSRRAYERFSSLLQTTGWGERNEIPSESEWRGHSIIILKEVRDDLEKHAAEIGLEFYSLGCTIIVVIFSPYGILATHIGDGRAGFRNNQGEWKPLIVPFKGEEVGQTVFITSDIWEKADIYIESRSIADAVSCFALMTDGCERAAFRCYDKRDDIEQYYDPNEPYPAFFDPNVKVLRMMWEDDLPQEKVNEHWANFLVEGVPALKNESDDKTMILGVLARSCPSK